VSGLCAQLTYEFQINQPPPLGHPDCQFPELTLPGMCANMIVYIPSSPNAVREWRRSLCSRTAATVEICSL